MKMPELYELISVFECEPHFHFVEDVPWYYNSLYFTLDRGEEVLTVSMEPACGIFDFEHYIGKRLVSHAHLENSKEFKIERIHEKEIIHIDFGEGDGVNSFFVVAKPYISINIDYRRV